MLGRKISHDLCIVRLAAQVLSAIDKGETYETSAAALQKLKDAGIKRSIMILIGLGGKHYSHDHVIRSADLCSEAIPEFLSLLTVSPTLEERAE